MFLFLSYHHSHFAFCQSNIVVNTLGAHNLQLTKDILAILSVPENYQAFIFSNVDMGPNNAFYLDNAILRVPYKNLFGIAFNGSSQIIIKTSEDSQNLAAFIVPSQNCEQHAFYVMNKNDFKIGFNTSTKNKNIQACGFQPSFITDIYQNVTFGVKDESDSSSQIFYGFVDADQPDSDESDQNDSNKIEFQSYFENIIEEMNIYIEFKKLYQIKSERMKTINKKNQKKLQKNKIINFLLNADKFDSNQFNSRNKLQKDYDEETFFQKNYQSYINYNLKTKRHQNSNQLLEENIIDYRYHSNNFSSPGFANSSTTSTIKSLTTVNTEFYTIYKMHSSEKSSEIILERKFISDQEQPIMDDSMLSSHYDFLLYFDKKERVFIYDNEWTINDDKNLHKSYFWKIMKWFLALVIIVFSIIIVFIVVSVINYSKRNRKCCFKKMNLNQGMNEEDYDLNMAYPNARRRSRHRNFDPNNLNESELETICYSPDLDEMVTYSKTNKKSDLIDNYENIHDSDSYVYEYSYSACDDESTENHHGNNEDNNANNRKGSIRIKKRVKRMKMNSVARASTSPYDINANNETDIGEFSADNYTSNETLQDDHLGDNGEIVPNPYGLPAIVHNSVEATSDEASNV